MFFKLTEKKLLYERMWMLAHTGMVLIKNSYVSLRHSCTNILSRLLYKERFIIVFKK